MSTTAPDPKRPSYFCALAWGMIPFGFVLAIIVALCVSERTTSFEGGKGYALVFSFLLVLLGCTVPCAIFCAISMIRKERRALLSLIPGIPCGLIALFFVSSVARTYIASKREGDQVALEEKLLADAHADVTCILRDRWDLKKDYAYRHGMVVALHDQQAHISDSLAHEIYQTMPNARDGILDHPAFDAKFLSKCFQEIKARAFVAKTDSDKDVYMLHSIVNNPNCPREILEAVVNASRNNTSLYWVSTTAQKRLETPQEKPATSAPPAP